MAGPLTVRLLGPFEVEAGGRPVSVTAGRLRALLAALAMSPGQVVPVERLATAVWDADPPEDVRRSLSTYATRLRNLVGADAIGTGPGGYVLRTEPDRVDALRLLRLTDSVRADADPRKREALLAEALGLWRGEPFEGVPARWLVQAMSPRLVEAYLEAVERRIDLDVGRRRYAGLVAELMDLTGRFPLRESLWLRLIVVLDHSGSPAEALACYDRLRVHLADELGADPGPELQQAHADLLAGRPTRLAGAVPAARVTPAQLPADLETFSGRQRNLAELDALLPGAGRVVVVHGPPGVGKTATAVHWAHGARERFPDGQLYINLRGFEPTGSMLSATDALRNIMESLPNPPDQIPPDLPARTGLYRSLLSGKRTLVLLDNAHDAEQVRPLLPGDPGCAVLATSRSTLAGLVTTDSARLVRLDLLDPAESRQLLIQRLGRARVAAAPGAVDDIVDTCAGLPLALAIVAARAADPGAALSAVAAELRAAGSRLDAFAGDDVATDLRTVFSWSYRMLSPAAQRLFRLLGLPTGPDITTPAAAALAGTSPARARLLLGELTRASLVSEPKPGRYALHDLLRALAAELAAEHDGAGRSAAVSRLVGFYLATARATVPLLSPGDHRRIVATTGGLDLPDETAALQWLDAERPNLVAAVRQAANTPGAPEQIAPGLAQALFAYFSVRPHWDDWAEVNETALEAARRLGDLLGEAWATYDLGFVSWLRGRFTEAEAWYDQSLAVSRCLADRAGEAAGLAGLGDVQRVLGNGDRAVAHYEASLAICRRLGDLHGQTRSLGSLGVLYQGQGRTAEALACLRESLAIRHGFGDRRGEATSLSNLGAFHHREGRYDEALHHYERSLAMRREQGDRHGEGTSLAGLAAAHQATRRLTQALDLQRESVAIFREMADNQCLGENLRALATTLESLDHRGEARDARREAAEIFARLGSPDKDPAAPVAGLRQPAPDGAESR